MYTIPNEADAGNSSQAEPDKVDFDILSLGVAEDGVVESGCAVTAQGSPDQTVAVAAGFVIVAGVMVAVAAGNVSMAAADGSNPRFDLVWVDNTGTKGKTDGTAAAAPVIPAIPTNSVPLAVVYRATSNNTIATADIIDKRLKVPENQRVQSTADMATRATTVLADITGLKFAVRANATYYLKALIPYSIQATTAVGVRIGATFPAGIGVGNVNAPLALTTGNTGSGSFNTSGGSASIGSGVVATGTTRQMAILDMIIRPTSDGTVQIQYGAELGTTTGSIVVHSRAIALLWRVG